MADWQPPTLSDGRVLLRPVTLADINAIHAACSNPRMTQYTIFETHTERKQSESFVCEYALPNYRQQIPDPLAIALASDPQTLIGCCGGRWTESRCNRSIEFGYWLAEGYWGQGITTAAVKLLVPFLFQHYEPERVQAHVLAPNTASARVLEKAGLQFEGTFRRAVFRRGTFWDVKMYSILKNEIVIAGV